MKHNNKRGKKLRIRLSNPYETKELLHLKLKQEKSRIAKADLSAGLALYHDQQGGGK